MASTLYDILGVSSIASLTEIKAAYKSLAKKHHPDINNGSTWHEEQFKKINQAYQILSDAGKRRQYDSRLEYEAFIRQNPVYQQPPPTPKKTNQTHTKSTHQSTSSSYKPRPAANKKKAYIVTISDKQINLLVVGYYAVLILLLGSFYELREYFKIKNLLEQAQAHESKNEYSRAIGFYTSILTIDDEHTKAYEKRAEAKIKLLADYEWALNDFTASIQFSRKPTDSLWFKRARCFFQLKRYEAAIQDIDQILKGENPGIDSAYFYKAESNYFLKNFSLSIPDYTHFLTLQPQAGLAFSHRGYCYYNIKQYPKAINDFTAAINWQPYNSEYYYYRGLSKIGLNDTHNACTDLTDAFLLGSVEAGVAKSTHCPKSNL